MNITETVRKNCTLPNMLTVLRIAIIIPLARCILAEKYVYAGIFLIVSAVSDMFDGMTARKFHQVTRLGKIIDPIAEKLKLIAVVRCISKIYDYVYPFVIVMFLKEIIMLTGGAVLLKKNIKPPAAQWYGKAATVVFYSSMILLIALRAVWKVEIYWLSLALFGVSTGFMIFAFMNYAVIFLRLLKKNRNKK